MKSFLRVLFYIAVLILAYCYAFADDAASNTPQYYLSDLQYDGKAVTGRIIHDDSTPSYERLSVRVTFFLPNGYCMSSSTTINNDTFNMTGVGPIEYISVLLRGLDSTTYVPLDAGELILDTQPWDSTIPVSGLLADYSDGVLTVSATSLNSYYTVRIDGNDSGRSLSPAAPSVTINKLLHDGIHNVTIESDTKGVLFTNLIVGQLIPDFELPASLIMIKEEAFRSIPASIIRVSNNVISIASKAFADCSNLKVIILGENVSFISADAFEGSPNVIAVVPDIQFVIDAVCETGIPYIIQ